MNNLPLDIMKKITENQIKNLSTMRDCEPANNLVMRYRNKAAVIVAAGPSLDRNIKQILQVENRDDVIVIGVDAALMPMINAGLRAPDYVATVDYQDVTFDKFYGLNYFWMWKDMDCVFIPEVTYKVPDIKFGKKYYAYLGVSYKAIFDEILGVDCVYSNSISNCSNLALFSAQIMGCDPIIFLGHDFQLTGGRDHATGTILNLGNNHPEEKPYAEAAKANTEGMIKAVKRTYINATEGGAGIVGAEEMTFAQAIKRIGRRQFDMAMEFKKLILDVRRAQKKKDPKKAENAAKRFGSDPRVHMLAGLMRSRTNTLSLDVIEEAAGDMLEIVGK